MRLLLSSQRWSDARTRSADARTRRHLQPTSRLLADSFPLGRSMGYGTRAHRTRHSRGAPYESPSCTGDPGRGNIDYRKRVDVQLKAPTPEPTSTRPAGK